MAANILGRVEEKFRRYTHFLRPLPDFVIIGGMKCGSTALFQYLIQHPQIQGSVVKEVHFFDSRYAKGLKWYRKHFPIKLPGRVMLTGEASPYYIFHPAVPERIWQTLPGVKLIALLRNPVDRAYLHYQHAKRKGFENLSFEEAIEAEPDRLKGERERLLADVNYRSSVYSAHSYVARGIYWEQLTRYYRFFDPSQILVLQSERLLANPQDVVNQTVAFLGLPPFTLSDAVPKNKAEYAREPTAAHRKLAAYFRPHNEKLYELIGERYDWDKKYEEVSHTA